MADAFDAAWDIAKESTDEDYAREAGRDDYDDGLSLEEGMKKYEHDSKLLAAYKSGYNFHAKVKKADYERFGEKFARKIMDMKEGAKGLPEGTKFSDLRSTSPPSYVNVIGSKSGLPDIKDILRDIDERRVMDMVTGGSSAPNPFIPDNIKYPKSLIDRAKKQSGMPQPDIETEEFES